MKKFLIIFLSIAMGILIILFFNRMYPEVVSVIKQTKTIPTITTQFSFDKAPNNSLPGQITSLSGNVKWQSRSATEAAQITSPRALQQGENISTEDTGTVTFEIKNSCTVSLSPNTKIEIIQTLPTNSVFTQDKGTAIYKKMGTLPLSLHALGLLIDQQSGDMTVTVNDVLHTVNVHVTRGAVTIAYEDTEIETQIVQLTAGQTYIFDNDAKEGGLQ